LTQEPQHARKLRVSNAVDKCPTFRYPSDWGGYVYERGNIYRMESDDVRSIYKRSAEVIEFRKVGEK
jgi:hypothetical protein